MSTDAALGMVTELVWRGRLHLGDEPGIYGNASYVGLCTEWPITLKPFAPGSGTGNAILRLTAQDAGISAPYPGHKVTMWRHEPAPTPENPFAWTRVQLNPASDYRLSGSEIAIEAELPKGLPSHYLSVRIEVDTTLQPGLYDDFVVVELSMLSLDFYASLGFRFESVATMAPEPG